MPNEQPVIRPGTIVLTLVLMGISALFAGLCAAYTYSYLTGHLPAPRPPWVFVLNIPVLLVATQVLARSRRTFDARQTTQLLGGLLLCAGLSIVFIILQVLGWTDLFTRIPSGKLGAYGYLFLLSILHMLHVIAGIPFLAWFAWQYKDGDMVHFTADRRAYLTGLIRYWHFLDILWILLVAVLWAGALLS